MLAILVALAASVVGVPLDQDPSLAAPATCGQRTAPSVVALARASSSGLLFDYDNIYLTWDAVNNEFGLVLDSSAVTDLVTTAGSGKSYLFEGDYVGGKPTVSGSVDDPTASSWVLDISRDGKYPMEYGVYASGSDVVISMGKSCECTDQISMNCDTHKCNAGETCTGGTPHCYWKTVTIP